MELHIALDGRDGLAEQIYRQLRAAILKGRLRQGQAVPSTRELAARLTVSRNTVNVAYDRLLSEGFLASRPGVGTYVSDNVAARAPVTERTPRQGTAVTIRPVWRHQPIPVDMSVADPDFDFRPGLPDARHFPYATWRALMGHALRETTVGRGAYIDPAGHPPLRAAIARHIGVSRGVAAVPEQVMITNGTQQAVDLIARVLLEPGDLAAVEDPGWVPPPALFETLGARVVRVPVDDEGMIVDALPDETRLVHVSPSHQFPLGVPMSLRRRLGLLAWARRTGAVIIEDDYDSEFRYVGRPVEPLHTLDDGSDRIVYVGSFSKTLLPTFRMGFCVAPPAIHRALRMVKYVADWHTVLPIQVALARYIEQGLFARHIRRMRGVYRLRRDRIAHTLARDFTGLLDPIPSVAGLHMSARLLDPDLSDRHVVARARRAGVAVMSLSEFAGRGSPGHGLIFGFGVIPADRIDDGLRLLRRCLHDDESPPVTVP